jgi:hypothetical protein
MMFVILTLGAVMASADTIASDGDTLNAGNNTTVALGTVSPGATLHPTVRFFLSCGGNKHVDLGQTVTLSYHAGGSTVAAGGTLSASSGALGPIPPSWVDDGTNCPNPDSSPLSSGSLGSDSTVTITAPSTPGSYSYTVAYSASLTPVGTSDPSSVTGAVPTVTYTLTVAAPSQQSQMITFGQPASPQSYGDTFNVSPTASSGLAVTVAAGAGSVCTVAAAATGVDVTMTSGSGNCVLVASQGGNDGFFASTNVTRTVAAQPRPVMVRADAQSKTYGDADPSLTYQVTSGSLVAGDGFSGSLTRDAGEDVGECDITQGTLALTGNYELSYVGAKLAITARPVTVSADAQSKTYGDADPSLTYQVTSGSLVAGDGFSGSLTRDAGEDVGEYDITQGTLALTGNYDLSYVGATLTITARPVTVTADDKTKVLGASDPAFTYQVTSGSLVAGDSFTGSLTRDPGESIGSYAITQGTLALSSNYNLAFVPGTLKIMYAASGPCGGGAGHQVLQPINADGSSVYKGGSTVPVKFRVCDVNGVSIGSAGVVASFRLVKTVSGTDTQVLDDGTTSTTPDTSFRWDPTDRQWIYNLSTKGLRTTTTYYYVITLNDGSTISFHFGLK